MMQDNKKMTKRERPQGAAPYFIPKPTRVADTVVCCKYISRNNVVDGYNSGHTFANQLELSINPGSQSKIPIPIVNVQMLQLLICVIISLCGMVFTQKNSFLPVDLPLSVNQPLIPNACAAGTIFLKIIET